MQRKKDINSIIIMAVLVRVITLMVIAILGFRLPALGFIDNSHLYDDYRYEQGAFLYEQQAKTLFDAEAFTAAYDSLEDWTGHNLSNPLDSTPLWYWICCILVYVTKTRWSIRVLNIVLFAAAIKVIWKIANEIYGEDAADLAAKLMSFMPYFVIFSCFSYKDVLVMLCTFSLFWKAISLKKGEFGLLDFGIAILDSAVMLFMRSGLIIVLLGLLLIYLFLNEIKLKMKRIVVLFLPICVVAGTLGIYKFSNVLIYKFVVYNVSYQSESLGMGKFLKISGISEMWKLPITYFVSVLQPIQIFSKIDSWYAVICNVNIVMIPIALGSLLYVFIGKKKDKAFFFVTVIYYLITAVSSILIFRQIFSLLPIPVMYYASLWKSNCTSRNTKGIVLLCSALVGGMLMMLFLL